MVVPNRLKKGMEDGHHQPLTPYINRHSSTYIGHIYLHIMFPVLFNCVYTHTDNVMMGIGIAPSREGEWLPPTL